MDDSLEGLDELNETLELSGAKLGQGHTQLPLYRAPSLDWAVSGQNGIRFNRDDAFRRISRSFHAVKDSEYTPPASLQKVLRKYQRDGYRWLRTLDGYGMGGILADDMGLGKTVQVLSYLLAMKENGQERPGKPKDEGVLPSLIVGPASLVLNWAEECQKFTPELHCLVVDGDAAHRAALAKQWGSADVVVTSYDLLRRDEELYAGQAFYACILDEAQAIKNHTTQKYKAVCQINSRVRFALTGTPAENRLGELWSIFSFLMPGYLPPYKSFCTRFEKPIVQEDDKAAARRLNQLTGPFLLRRMKADVLKELPPRPRTSTGLSWRRSSASSIWQRWWTPGTSCRRQSRRTKWRCSPFSCGCGRSAVTPASSWTAGRRQRQRQAGRLHRTGGLRCGGRTPYPAVQPVYLHAGAAGQTAGRRGHQPLHVTGLHAQARAGGAGPPVQRRRGECLPHLAAGRRHRPQPDGGRHRHPLRPVVECGGSESGHRPRLPHRAAEPGAGV